MKDNTIKKVLLLGSGALKRQSGPEGTPRGGHQDGAYQSEYRYGADLRGCSR